MNKEKTNVINWLFDQYEHDNKEAKENVSFKDYIEIKKAVLAHDIEIDLDGLTHQLNLLNNLLANRLR